MVDVGRRRRAALLRHAIVAFWLLALADRSDRGAADPSPTESLAPVRTAPGRWRPHVGRSLAVAAVSAGVGVGLVVVPGLSRKPRAVIVDMAKPGSPVSLSLSGAGDRAAKVTVVARRLSIGASTDRSARKVDVVLKTSADRCRTLARELTGGCGRRAPRGHISADEVVVDAGAVAAAITASGRGSALDVERGQRSVAVGFTAPRATFQVACGSPHAGGFVLYVAGRRHAVPCGGSSGRDLWLTVPRAAPSVDLFEPSRVSVRAHARTVGAVAEQPTLVVGGRAQVLFDRSSSIDVTGDGAQDVSLEQLDVNGRELQRLSVGVATSVRVAGHGEQLPSGYEQHKEVLLGFAGVFVGVAASALAALVLGERR